MFSTPQQPRSPWQIFLDSFRLYKKAFMGCLPFLILVIVFDLLAKAFAPEQIDPNNVAVTPLLLSLICSLIGIFIYGGVILRVHGVLYQRSYSFSQALLQGMGRNILAVVAMVAWFFVLSVVSILFFMLCRYIPVVGTALAAIIVGVVWIYVVVNLLPWTLLIMVGTGPLTAWKNSFELVKGHWWRTFAVLLLAVITMFIADAIIMLLTGTSFAQLMGKATENTAGLYLYAIITTLLIPGWIYSVLWLQVQDLLLRKGQSL